MDCKRVAELLPRYLNGMLDDGNQKQVEEHLAHCAACRQEREESLLMLAIYEQHVPTAVLADYAFERPLETFEPGLIERHVQTCSSCAEELVLAQEGHRSLEAEPLAATTPWWHRLPWRDRLRTSKAEGAALPNRASSGLGFWPTGWRNPAWVLSCLGIVITGIAVYKAVILSKEGQHRDAYYESLVKQDQAILKEKEATIAQLSRKIAELSKQNTGHGEANERLDALLKEKQAQENTIRELTQKLESYRQPRPEAVLVAALATGRDSGEGRTIRLSKDTLFVILQAQVSPLEEGYPSYRLVLKDAAKKAVSQKYPVQEPAKGLFNYLIASDALKHGSYTLEIYGVQGHQEFLILEARFRILAGPP